MRPLALAAAALLFPLAAAASCPDPLKPHFEVRMFFGLSHVDGRTVSDDQWRRFVADTVTPRFPAGFTVLDARGQWTKPDGALEREPVKLMIGAIAEDRDGTVSRAREISRVFAGRFRQEPPFTILKEACAGGFWD